MVIRQLLVKWWDKFNSERVLSQFSEEFSVIPSSSGAPVSIQPASPIPQLKSQTPQLSSLSKNKVSSSSSFSKADELKELVKQLLQQAASLSTDDERQHSPSESSLSYSHQSYPNQPTRWADYEDNQDPYPEF
ncbi:hypothetical protein ACLB2K_072612 [Fragaria x ananassa]